MPNVFTFDDLGNVDQRPFRKRLIATAKKTSTSKADAGGRTISNFNNGERGNNRFLPLRSLHIPPEDYDDPKDKTYEPQKKRSATGNENAACEDGKASESKKRKRKSQANKDDDLSASSGDESPSTVLPKKRKLRQRSTAKLDMKEVREARLKLLGVDTKKSAGSRGGAPALGAKKPN